MARVIGVINAKGGVGKTTTANNLGAALASAGKYVLLVDLDPQANATAGLGIRVEEDQPNLYHAIVDNHHPEAIIKKANMLGFDVLPSAASLAGATVELVSMPKREFKLKRALDKVRTNYDYILIDSPPSLGLLTVNCLAAAEHIIIPVQCEYYALEGLTQLLGTIDLVRQSVNPNLKIMGALLTMYDKRNTLARQVVEEVRKNFPGHVFSSVIPRSVSLAEAPSFAKTIIEFDPKSNGAKAYMDLAQEIINLQ